MPSMYWIRAAPLIRSGLVIPFVGERGKVVGIVVEAARGQQLGDVLLGRAGPTVNVPIIIRVIFDRFGIGVLGRLRRLGFFTLKLLLFETLSNARLRAQGVVADYTGFGPVVNFPTSVDIVSKKIIVPGAFELDADIALVFITRIVAVFPASPLIFVIEILGQKPLSAVRR